MMKDSMKQLLHMRVCEGIVDVLSLSALLYKALTAKDTKALRYKRKPLTFCDFAEFRHTTLALSKQQ